jgi:hypothetical protein
VFEFSELLMDEGVEDVGGDYPYRVTYHPTCHSLRKNFEPALRSARFRCQRYSAGGRRRRSYLVHRRS